MSSVFVNEVNPADVRTASKWLLSQVPDLEPWQALKEASAALAEAHPRRLVHGTGGYRKGQCRCGVCKAGEQSYVATRGAKGTRCGTPTGFNKHVALNEEPCIPCRVAMTDAEANGPRLKEPTTHDQCGSPSGYTKHHRMGEKICPRCKEARDEYRATRRANKKGTPVVA